jgi:gas vesicle protein
MKDVTNFLVGMIVGAVVGAVVALFYAPKSGAELRADIQNQADSERQRLQALYEEKLGQMQTQLNDVHQDVSKMLESAKPPAEAEASAGQENA